MPCLPAILGVGDKKTWLPELDLNQQASGHAPEIAECAKQELQVKIRVLTMEKAESRLCHKWIDTHQALFKVVNYDRTY